MKLHQPTLKMVALLTVLFVARRSCIYAAVDQPNVLFIAIDDLNDWIGILKGHPQTKTPHLDALASKGVLFANAHCAAPACNPSRAALLTGIPPYQSGVYTNSQPWRPSMPNAITIPQYFSQHGYWSAGTGKIFHGRFRERESWDLFAPENGRSSFPGAQPAKKNINGLNKAHFDWGPLDVEDAEMSDAKSVAWTCKQLTQKHRKPFFLACGIYRPHLPWYVPRKYFDQFPIQKIILPKILANDLQDVPAAGIRMARPQGDHAAVVKGKQWKLAVQGYLASIAFADAQVGRLLNALNQGPHRQNTIIVLWTDHGWHLGEKEHWRKFALWERATRTPLIFVVPAGVNALPQGTPAHRVCQEAVSLMDIYPTLIELCSLKSRNEISGKSLVPLLKNPDLQTNRSIVTTHGRNNHSIRNREWRYIRYADGSEELYHHKNDPQEWQNLAGEQQYQSIKKQLAHSLPQQNAPNVRPVKKSRVKEKNK